MKADELAEIMRKGDAKLRVDRVVVTAGKTTFRGAGLLRVAQKELHLDVTLSGKSIAPGDGKSVWMEEDFWKVRGVIEHSLPFTATHVSPGKRSSSGTVFTVTLDFQALELACPRRSAKKIREMRRLFDEAAQKYRSSAEPPTAEPAEKKPSRKTPIARFFAVFVNCKLLARNTTTCTMRRNPFLGKTTSWKADTFVARGREYDVALIKRHGDLHLHFRSKGRYQSKSYAEDRERFQSVLDAIGFTHGFNPWPQRIQQWREGKLVSDRITAPRRLAQTTHAPFDQTLGCSDVPPPIHLVTRFFSQRSSLSRKISELLFLFRQAGDEMVHLPVRTLAFCSLFEGFVYLLFDELKLEKKLRKTSSGFDEFLRARDQLAADLKKKGQAGDQASQRLAGLVSHADAVRVKDKFKVLCEAFGLDYSQMKPHFEAWYDERNPLMHGTWREHRDTDFVHQARIAGAINILLLKLMGYSGKMVAVRFGASETYRTI